MVANSRRRDSSYRRLLPWGVSACLSCFLFALTSHAWAADLDDAERLFRTGRYDECATLAAKELAAGFRGVEWYQLKIRAELARGRYQVALGTFAEAARRYPINLPLHLLGREVYRLNGREDEAREAMNALEKQIISAPQRYATAPGFVALGRFFLMRGADARKVLDQFYDVAKKQQPDLVDVYLATAELALQKQDHALAAETLQKAPKGAAEDPRFHYLLARAFANDDRVRSAKAIADALALNPSHADSLLLQADQFIDGERYAEAEKVLRQVLDVNPFETRATAYLAVLAHFKNDLDGEKSLRTLALSRWAEDPEVDHLIGRKLSEKYRFTEGASHQRAALELDSGYLPAKIQLCQDLLRLGEETEGWKLAGEIFAQDGYNVVAYNLSTLRDRIAGFRTLTDDGLILRMDPREADLYGQRALSILRLARKTIGAKYDVVLDQPVIVEIFPQRKEFAVRTFGLPGADGFLGVCFGRVVTANSPASQGEHPSNWESVLWHEFCHVVTLKKTRNKMPRWLSEGISVYEEEQRDPAWGTPLNPRFRAMLLDPKLTPLSKLSAAFLAPESGVHLQFAYQESALAVHFLVERFGLETLKSMLDDLGAGLTINEVLPHRSKMSLEQLDREFREFARAKARKVAPDATWEEPELPGDADSSAISAWLEQHPKSFHGWRRLCARLVLEEKWDRAVVSLERLKQLFPEYVGPENSYVMLADVYKRTANGTAERAALEQLAARDGSASPVYLRLMELDLEAADWPRLAIDARRFLAVNPLVPAPYRMLARAADQLGDRIEAVSAYRALALLDDADPAEVHYRLARLLRDAGDPTQARREVLMSLEEAPRFLAAHRLLLELVEPAPPATSSPPSSPRPRR